MPESLGYHGSRSVGLSDTNLQKNSPGKYYFPCLTLKFKKSCIHVLETFPRSYIFNIEDNSDDITGRLEVRRAPTVYWRGLIIDD